MSDLPAMRNTALNSRSFSLRGQSSMLIAEYTLMTLVARPSSSHLPSTSSSYTSPFCHSCLANQTLITNMLANYLPDDDVR